MPQTSTSHSYTSSWDQAWSTSDQGDGSTILIRQGGPQPQPLLSKPRRSVQLAGVQRNDHEVTASKTCARLVCSVRSAARCIQGMLLVLFLSDEPQGTTRRLKMESTGQTMELIVIDVLTVGNATNDDVSPLPVRSAPRGADFTRRADHCRSGASWQDTSSIRVGSEIFDFNNPSFSRQFSRINTNNRETAVSCVDCSSVASMLKFVALSFDVNTESGENSGSNRSLTHRVWTRGLQQ